MNKQSVIKKISVAIVTFGLVTILFSSCHRGYGCPGKITYDAEVETEQAC